MNTQPFKHTSEGKMLWKDTTEADRNTEIAKACDNARLRMGQIMIDEGVYSIALKDLISLISEKYKWVSIPELKEILKLGSMGQLGDNISMSTRTISGWFENYFSGYRREISKKVELETPKLPEPKTARKLTDQEVDEYMQGVYELYHESGIVATTTWDILDKYGRIKNTKSEMARFLDNAKAVVKMEMSERVKTGIITTFDYVNALNSESTMEMKIDNCAKRLAVAHLFDLMKLKEKPVVSSSKKGAFMAYRERLRGKSRGA